MDFALNCDFFDALFEGDAQTMINLINNKDGSLVAYDHIIDKRSSFSFKFCSWYFIRQCDNSIIHCLTKHVRF